MSYVFAQTPTSPDYRVEFDAIAPFPWMQAMKGVQQEPEWHAEGDVFTHTRMVAEAMAELPGWRAMAESDRHLLFAGALLHDVAKPRCTRFEAGRWTSPRHAKVGEGFSRRLLWTGEAGAVPAFFERERVAKLVRYHGLPLRFLDKPDPERAVVLASLEVNLSDAALLAQADVLGRVCEGKDELLASVDAFADYATELGCATGPFRFEHDLHRFMYCVGGKPLGYVPYQRPVKGGFEALLMSGLPGSGKSTAARILAGDRPIIDLDEIRRRQGVDGGDDQTPVILEAKEQAKTYLRGRTSFVWDATNVTRDLRAGLIALFANYGALTRIVYVEAPSRQDIFARNRER